MTPIDHAEVVAFFTSLKQREGRLTIWYHDPESGTEGLVGGYVETITDQLLFIETHEERWISFLLKAGSWYPMNPEDAPVALQAIWNETYNFGLHFRSQQAQNYFLGNRPATQPSE
jgi:hypothetical protein